jgi:hypothetical protein
MAAHASPFCRVAGGVGSSIGEKRSAGKDGRRRPIAGDARRDMLAILAVAGSGADARPSNPSAMKAAVNAKDSARLGQTRRKVPTIFSAGTRQRIGRFNRQS